MNMIWLEDFLALAATGNFTKAAELRHSSQPAFSRRIRALEEWLGTDLIDRSTQPAVLTAVGEWFRSQAQDILTKSTRLPAEARALAESSSMELRLTATHALSFTFLPRWLKSLESHIPLGPIHLMSDVLQRCESVMTQGKAQFAIAHAHPDEQGLLDNQPYLHHCLAVEYLIPVSIPTQNNKPRFYLSSNKTEPTPILRYSEESGLGRITRHALDGYLSDDSTQVIFTAHLASVLRSMVLDGRGIAWLPASLIQEDLLNGQLVIAAESNRQIPLEIRLYRHQDPMSPSAECFWQAAQQAGPNQTER